MKATRSILCSALLVASPAMAQSEFMMQEVNRAKSDALAAGYTLLDDGSMQTWWDVSKDDGMAIQFETSVFLEGYTYLVGMFVDDPGYTDIVFTWGDDNGSSKVLPADIERGSGLTRARVLSTQQFTANGRIHVYAASRTPLPSYGMLFYKAGY